MKKETLSKYWYSFVCEQQVGTVTPIVLKRVMRGRFFLRNKKILVYVPVLHSQLVILFYKPLED